MWSHDADSPRKVPPIPKSPKGIPTFFSCIATQVYNNLFAIIIYFLSTGSSIPLSVLTSLEGDSLTSGSYCCSQLRFLSSCFELVSAHIKPNTVGMALVRRGATHKRFLPPPADEQEAPPHLFQFYRSQTSVAMLALMVHKEYRPSDVK